MLQHIAYKYRLVPTEEQKVYFSKCFGCARLVYNRYVAFSKEDNARVKAEGENTVNSHRFLHSKRN